MGITSRLRETQIEVTVPMRAPLETVFARLSDHEGMARWPGVKSSVLAREGTPDRNGLGAIRRLRVPPLSIDEEIVEYQPPTRYDYEIIRGLPVDHHGTVTLRASDDQVWVTWQVRLSARVPLFAPTVGFLLERGLRRALGWVKSELESAQA